ncbi:hypothetical protein ACQPZJ_36930 [Actinoplanes sp. CA-054009]
MILRRGWALVAYGCAGWLLLIPLLWLARTPFVAWTIFSVAINWAGLLFAALVSITVIVKAARRRSWAVALASLLLATTGAIFTAREKPQLGGIDYQYRAHRTQLADLARDYRAGRLHGELRLPSGLRSLCPSGFAYANDTVLFVQAWQDWRAESGTGFAYFPTPPTEPTWVTTAWGDSGRAHRPAGDGWWWVE